MCQCFETLQIKNQQALHVNFHNERFNKTRYELFNAKKDLNLLDFLDVKNDARCKIVYDKDVKSVEYFPIVKRKFEHFLLVECDFTYEYKYLNRQMFKHFENCDDVIYIKNGILLDTSIANIALLLDNTWYCTNDVLLKGTTRQRLLENNAIKVKTLHVNDLFEAKSMAIMNAIVGFLELKNTKFTYLK